MLHTRKIPILDRAREPVYLLGVSQDITEQRAAHEQIRLARLEAERASRAKSEFLSRMSHRARRGHVWCESEEGHGATFAFTLPVTQPEGGQ